MKYIFDKYHNGYDDWATVFEIYEEDEEKYIHYAGYGYYSETGIEDDPTPYRIVEYTWFIAPLEEVLDFEKATGESYESEFSAGIKQYIEDCSYEALINAYEHWFNGEAPQPLPSEGLTIDIPCGCYYM